MDEKFTKYIQQILQQRGGLNGRHVNILTKAEPMKIFRKAFTDKSFDPEENYERLEFVGDSILAGIAALYIFKLHPLSTEKNYTLWKNMLVERKGLVIIGRELGVGRYIRSKEKVSEKTIENVVEALIAAITLTVNNSVTPTSLGFSVAEDIISPLFKLIDISRPPVKDAITRLKELEDLIKRKYPDFLETKEDVKDGVHTISIFGKKLRPTKRVRIELGDINVKDFTVTRELLGQAKSREKAKAKQEASAQVLKYYGSIRLTAQKIRETRPQRIEK